ncbi:hypothetical protein L228DRAFT_209965 [Xylona heveae TC161]|uniref:Uncharacterized protein n=1 Tax=Xylona heveae (strain CBS 132557 / TC161) TaxID=1328760 RepID=A0A165HFB2_XYLHT|nr:hypothetical protein L228DRAFT_209965 [Xylona heveae TC161]KZF23424.1 hypothetical protein L228DRAFT_209965 [Xylona heveae TC161]
MPKNRPAASGYERIAQADEESTGGFSDESDDDVPYRGPALSIPGPRFAPIQPRRQDGMQSLPSDYRRPNAERRRRMRSNSSGVDLKAINARLERWADEIASKFKIGKVKGKTAEEEQLEIHHSVFQAPEWIRPTTAETVASEGRDDSSHRMTKLEFDDVVESVKVAIELGIHPKMISQGSSGSYFARNADGKVVGVFKPKDEEPYASRNPKWTKWIHRNLFPCFFGRACLIPNLSYVSEAAAYVLDSRLQTNLVPYTDIVYLSSKSFYYDFWDRRSYYRKHKPLPQKVGSFQVFLRGYKDANIFLREHPWPDQLSSHLSTEGAPKRVKRPWNETCRPGRADSDDEDDSGLRSRASETEPTERKFMWTETLQQAFREELEKLVILDYIMRNTDRGLDNWMIKVDWQNEEVSIVSEPPRMDGENGEEDQAPRPVNVDGNGVSRHNLHPYRSHDPMAAISRSATPSNAETQPKISIGAIDNSLSWPWKHPDAWRSFPFGWLFLPVSLIGQPFSQKTREHFLPILTSTKWWSGTQKALRDIFSQDSDFQEKMFARQIAVMKGQAWNVVETLKQSDHGPLELTRRARICVWDDLVDIPVVVPLRAASTEMRRQTDAEIRKDVEQEEEMDISAANPPAPLPQHDLLGLYSPVSELPQSHRFSLSRNPSSNTGPSGDVDESSRIGAAIHGQGWHSSGRPDETKRNGAAASFDAVRSKPRLSYEEPRPSRFVSPSHRRRYSFSSRRGSNTLIYEGDDLEGDLGYAAAEDMEGNRKKVIVERLETVKSRNPVASQESTSDLRASPFATCSAYIRFLSLTAFFSFRHLFLPFAFALELDLCFRMNRRFSFLPVAVSRSSIIFDAPIVVLTLSPFRISTSADYIQLLTSSVIVPHASRSSSANSAGQAQRFDPRVLLNPKAFSKAAQSKKESAPSASDSQVLAGKRKSSEPEARGMGSMIEMVHNVSTRDSIPSKRQKTEQSNGDEPIEKTNFAGGGKGGEIGEYMRKKREEGRKEQTASSGTVVDLTGGMCFNYGDWPWLTYFTDDEREVIVIEDNSEKEVCYGQVEGARVQAHRVPALSSKSSQAFSSSQQWPPIKVELRPPQRNTFIISVIDPLGHDIGSIDVRTSLGLAPLMNSSSVKLRCQARLAMRPRKPDEWPGQEVSRHFDLILNLYGLKKYAAGIGKYFSQRQIWLRAPFTVDRGIEVFNPHAIKSVHGTNTSSRFGSASGPGYVTRTVEEIRNDVIGMFDSLQKSETLPQMEPDPRIVTPLLPHQKQGLYFMTSKERSRVFSEKEECNSSLWRLRANANGQSRYYNVITGKEELAKPPEVLGGILADMMGLGKTLSILALLLSTQDDSVAFSGESPPEPQAPEDVKLVRNSKTTLLVAPLSTVANWEEQIKMHVQPGALSYYIFHGSNRCSDIRELSKYDLVITTYHVVSSELDGRRKKRHDGARPLQQTNWFRIVLDEAHMIREQSTRQCKAICALSAQRRWAVTGTPVQNRLDDLGALIKFLRLKPFDEKGGFAQYVLTPFKMADPEILPKLRLLVDTITLRRLKDRIELPSRHDQIVRLDFTSQERQLYEWFAKDSDSKAKVMASEERKSLGGKLYVHILRAILRLRLICAHGRELLSDEDQKMTEGLSESSAIDLEDEDDQRPALTPRQAYDMFSLMRESNADTCADCNRKVGQNELAPEEDKDDLIGFLTPCYQIICKDCIATFKEAVQKVATNDNHAICPLCEVYIRIAFFELKHSEVKEDEEARMIARNNPKMAKKLGRYGGPHTKTKTLIEFLKHSEVESEAQPNERPIKSVVFSGWTSHLDLIQIALDDNGIKYARLDGKMSRVQRSAALETFREDPTVRVILVSIAAGGLGLNLTSASRVYMMEPQFNPAAEAQAIDRIHRLGQMREVVTTRFIMSGSFEEKMLELQRKKQNLADLSMSRGKIDQSEAAKRRLEELRSLFK